MNVEVLELIQAVRTAGATLRADPPDLVISPAEVVAPELKARLREHKNEILAVLTSDDLRASCGRVEAMQIAVRAIPRTGGGAGWWLVSTASERSLVNDAAPVYEAREWLRILTSGLTGREIRQLDADAHQFRMTFGATVSETPGGDS